MGTLFGLIIVIICGFIFYRTFYQDLYYQEPHKDINILNRLKAAQLAELSIHNMDETQQYFKDIKDDLNRQLYHQYIISPEWHMKSAVRKSIDHHTCQLCGPTGKSTTLVVHHLHYRTLIHENINTDLVTLCKECHETLHASMDLETMEFYIQLNRIKS